MVIECGQEQDLLFTKRGKGTLKLTSYEIKFHGKSYSRANKCVFQRIQKHKKSGKKIRMQYFI